MPSSESSRNSTRTSCKAEVGWHLWLSSWNECLDSNGFLWIGGSGLGLWISRRIIHMHKVILSILTL